MSARHLTVILVIALLICSLLFQVQIKILVDQAVATFPASEGHLLERLWALRRIGLLKLVSAALLAIALLSIWLALLARLDLSVASPIGAIAIVTNAIGGGYLLGESPSAFRMAGILVVAIGVAMVLYG